MEIQMTLWGSLRPGAVWNGEAGPKGGGLEARNTVVHRQTDKTARCRLTAPEFKANLLQFRTKPLKLPPKPAQQSNKI